MGAVDEERFCAELENEVALDPEPGSTREIEEAVRVLLEGLGEDGDREGIKKTPLRVAKAFREGTRGYRQKVKDIVQGALFPEAGLDNGKGYAGGTGGLVVVRDINLFSYCESCLLPFRIQCHVGYIPSRQRVLGLSKLSRISDVFAKRLQEPQRLADEVCSALQSSIKPAGVAVVLLCWHIQLPELFNCDTNPKHTQGWVRASVCSKSGVFEDKDSSFWSDFTALLQFRGVTLESGPTSWCPSRSPEAPPCNGHSTKNLSNGRVSSKPGATHSAMITAVASILRSLGEDPSRAELAGTPYRYVQWLMNFKRSSSEVKLNASSFVTSGANYGHGRSKIHCELNLPFCSQCEHHLLPFDGVVHVAYFDEGEGRVFERSALQSVVHFYGCKLQVQERLTKQMAEVVHSVLGRGVMVVVEANHICMISRGIEKVGSSTATIAVLGEFSTDPVAKELFYEAISKTKASRG